jgi:hypothetical protein
MFFFAKDEILFSQYIQYTENRVHEACIFRNVKGPNSELGF